LCFLGKKSPSFLDAQPQVIVAAAIEISSKAIEIEDGELRVAKLERADRFASRGLTVSLAA
jgi:hypothetical protein